MDVKKGIKALLLMAGDGNRFGSATPKQFHRISGKKIYFHTLERFLESQLFEEIILVCPQAWMEEVEKEVAHLSSVKLALGGATRSQSSYQGLLVCGKETQIVVIHDAVRPFVTQRILEENISAALLHRAVDTCLPSTDTIVHSKEGEFIDEIPKREHYLRGQTPQSFAYELILKAHEASTLLQPSDDCQVVQALGHKIFIVKGDEANIKITSQLDLFLAEQLFRLQTQKIPSTENSLKGKRFAITGGTGGIGKAVVRFLQEEGAEGIAISRSADLSYDLTSSKAVKEAFSHLGKIDGVINCFGTLKRGPLVALRSQEIEELIATNLTGLIFCCKYAQVATGGHVVNIASSAYSRGRKDYLVYSSAKAAVVNFSQGYAEERPDLKVNVVVPQRTDTPMRRNHFPEDDPATLLHPDMVAKAIIDLLKTDLTGSIIEVR